MPDIYCVRAKFGKYAENFINGEYVAIGWLKNIDLSKVKTKEEIRQLYIEYYPEDTSPNVIGQQVGQISRFLFDMEPHDFIITFPEDTEYIHYGLLKDDLYNFEEDPSDGCPYPHRKSIKWIKEIQRSEFSIPIQYSLRSSLTVFELRHKTSFFEAIGREDLVPKKAVQVMEDNTKLILKRILELDYTEFELLITNLLSALGFEAEHVGKIGDDGVDIRGEMNLFNMAKVKLVAQAKRYRLESKISDKVVKDLRKNIPVNAQGAFITTCDFQQKALKIATEPGFPRIGTINGDQLVDLLTEKWDYINQDIREKLGLKKGLILE